MDWVTAMSGETIKNLHRCFGDLLLQTKIASISPVTTEIANQLGLAISAEADPYTSEDLVKAILEVVE
ncbi:MAG: uroporphyrinogen-III synthase [Planctomycetota bacterium]|nr:uroporphyrinogen-III synthase [Planctomycetota bacterium]